MVVATGGQDGTIRLWSGDGRGSVPPSLPEILP
jgi:hypothetical protein